MPFVDSGSLNPEPEFCIGISVMVHWGVKAPVEFLNVKSGRTRQINPKLWPSSISNSAELIDAAIAVAVPV